LQALVLLDDPQFLEAYRALAGSVLKTEAAQDARLTKVFRLATRRHPIAAEMAAMRDYYASQLQRYASDREAAVQLVSVGVTPVDKSIDPVQLAALTNLTTVVMNTPDAYSLR
jgi:predicted ATPase